MSVTEDEVVQDHLVNAKMHLQDTVAELNGISNDLRDKVLKVIGKIDQLLQKHDRPTKP